MANNLYDHNSYPANQAPLSSAAMRSELDSIEAGFDKLPVLTGNNGKIVRVTAGGDALEAVAAGTAVDIGALTNAATSKTTPVDADEIPIADSAASFGLKKLTWANLKATAKAYFDTLYVAINGALGTPSSGTLTNCTGLPAAGVTGTALVSAAIGTTVQGYDATTLKSAAIGTTVQAYDADTAKTDVAQTFTLPQRGTVTTDNDLSFDLTVTNNFFCTPSAGGALTFTNHTAGQSGLILFVNGSNYAITAAASTWINSADLTKLSATGTYIISYISNGTNTYCVVSASLKSAGAA